MSVVAPDQDGDGVKKQDPFAGMSVELTMLTPEVAAENAKKTRWQRRISKRTVKKYAYQQSAGQWKNYPALYVLDKDGNVIEGGHRTGSVLISGVSIPICLLKGADPSVIHAIDQNKPRSLQTNLELDGELASRELAQILKFLNSYRQGGDFESFGYTIEDHYGLLGEEPDVREIAKEWTLKVNLPKVPVGLLATIDYLVRTDAQENQHEFFLDCARGEAVADGDPAFAFREWVLGLGPKRSVKTMAKIGYTLVQCWDKFRRGQQISRVRAPGECPEIAPLESAQ